MPCPPKPSCPPHVEAYMGSTCMLEAIAAKEAKAAKSGVQPWKGPKLEHGSHAVGCASSSSPSLPPSSPAFGGARAARDASAAAPPPKSRSMKAASVGAPVGTKASGSSMSSLGNASWVPPSGAWTVAAPPPAPPASLLAAYTSPPMPTRSTLPTRQRPGTGRLLQHDRSGAPSPERCLHNGASSSTAPAAQCSCVFRRTSAPVGSHTSPPLFIVAASEQHAASQRSSSQWGSANIGECDGAVAAPMPRLQISGVPAVASTSPASPPATPMLSCVGRPTNGRSVAALVAAPSSASRSYVPAAEAPPQVQSQQGQPQQSPLLQGWREPLDGNLQVSQLAPKVKRLPLSEHVTSQASQKTPQEGGVRTQEPIPVCQSSRQDPRETSGRASPLPAQRQMSAMPAHLQSHMQYLQQGPQHSMPFTGLADSPGLGAKAMRGLCTSVSLSAIPAQGIVQSASAVQLPTAVAQGRREAAGSRKSPACMSPAAPGTRTSLRAFSPLLRPRPRIQSPPAPESQALAEVTTVRPLARAPSPPPAGALSSVVALPGAAGCCGAWGSQGDAAASMVHTERCPSRACWCAKRRAASFSPGPAGPRKLHDSAAWADVDRPWYATSFASLDSVPQAAAFLDERSLVSLWSERAGGVSVPQVSLGT
eukprot:CAMPEP_0176027264 /NCGR_PEP_ID=MMETSP0120_2-20121206/13367_1 /TAXON_ID=160619 /ORGANISM="Kryptoperidinium foliaceum, Strain CCMP 1326" /LENGTH=649 /DNA_ID=CAMNT_0017360467 /DNA_START=66 /DNA_END=2015 /DNA_ORIENTATION=+